MLFFLIDFYHIYKVSRSVMLRVGLPAKVLDNQRMSSFVAETSRSLHQVQFSIIPVMIL